MSIGLVYVSLLALGVVYALASGVFGWLSDLVGADGHVDLSGHMDAGHAHPVTGTTVATFITGFGGGGIVGHYLLHWGLLPGLLLATGSGLVLGLAAFLVLDALFSHTQAGSEFSVAEAVGREAEVITSIPADGTGEVAYVVRGRRETGPARGVDGGAVPRGLPVVIEKVLGNTIYVRPKV